MSMTTEAKLAKLKLAIHGMSAPFFCEGNYDPPEPLTFQFEDKSEIQVVRSQRSHEQEDNLKGLITQCKSAPFGDGKKTRYDRKVRDALQLKAEEFSVKGFDPASSGILSKIQRELLPHDANPISAELYMLNVYTRGGHFAPHKDTPRGQDMFGTLVVCLPSHFHGGDLILSHQGIVQKFDWSSAIFSPQKPNQLHWAAFFGDVSHQIEEVYSGARVTLTYLLRRGNLDMPPRPVTEVDPSSHIQEVWRALLTDEKFFPDGETLAYPCCHLYHQDARFQVKQSSITQNSATMLKGRDHLVAATAVQVGLEVSFNPYMYENCADETWQLDRFPTSTEKSKLSYRMDSDRLQKALPIVASSEDEGDFGVTWLEDPPSDNGMEQKSKVDSDLPAAAILHSCDYSPWGYFGNESSEIDLYIFAALHIEIPSFGEGVRQKTKSLAKGKVVLKPIAKPRVERKAITKSKIELKPIARPKAKPAPRKKKKEK